MLLGLIEGMGLLMNNFMSQQFRPQDPRMQEMPEEPPMVRSSHWTCTCTCMLFTYTTAPCYSGPARGGGAVEGNVQLEGESEGRRRGGEEEFIQWSQTRPSAKFRPIVALEEDWGRLDSIPLAEIATS